MSKIKSNPKISSESYKKIENQMLGKIHYVSMEELRATLGSQREFMKYCGPEGETIQAGFLDANRTQFFMCPGVIYSAISAHPEMKPSEAVKTFAVMMLSHEFGHRIDDLAYRREYRIKATCTTEVKPDKDKLNEIIGDFWGSYELGRKMIEDSKKGFSSKAIFKKWLKNSALNKLCTNGIYQALPDEKCGSDCHPKAKDRINGLLKNDLIRQALHCEPRTLGANSCDLD